jgi:uncharacterized iron-regulated membrane protein
MPRYSRLAYWPMAVVLLAMLTLMLMLIFTACQNYLKATPPGASPRPPQATIQTFSF